MSDKDISAEEIEAKVHDLGEAMLRMKNAQADRDDVVVDMRQAQRARLELLAHDLQPVFDKVPGEHGEQFEFALTSGEAPRLWVDMTSFVTMGADRRTYIFSKDTRLGRTILAESDNKGTVAQLVTDYVAQRIIEREQAVEGEWVSARSGETPEVDMVNPRPSRAAGFAKALFWFVLGSAAGIAALIGWVWYDMPLPI